MSSNVLSTGTFFFSVGLCAVAKMDISENPENHARHVGRHSVVDHNHRPQPAVTKFTVSHKLLSPLG
jgi:hypothetical protein